MAIKPKAGELRQRIRIERHQQIVNDLGDTVGAWRPLVSGVAARIEAVRGGEEVQANRLSGLSTSNITVRWSQSLAGVTATDRIVDERSGQVFDIRWAANLDSRSLFLTFLCEAGGVSNG